jgi:hypothetical protein
MDKLKLGVPFKSLDKRSMFWCLLF